MLELFKHRVSEVSSRLNNKKIFYWNIRTKPSTNNKANINPFNHLLFFSRWKVDHGFSNGLRLEISSARWCAAFRGGLQLADFVEVKPFREIVYYVMECTAAHCKTQLTHTVRIQAEFWFLYCCEFSWLLRTSTGPSAQNMKHNLWKIVHSIII